MVLAGDKDEAFHTEHFADVFSVSPGLIGVKLLPGIDHAGLILQPDALQQTVAAVSKLQAPKIQADVKPSSIFAHPSFARLCFHRALRHYAHVLKTVHVACGWASGSWLCCWWVGWRGLRQPPKPPCAPCAPCDRYRRPQRMPGVRALPGIDTGRKHPRSANAPGIASTSVCALCPRAPWAARRHRHRRHGRAACAVHRPDRPVA